jgi:hypothetical protein
VPKWERSTKQCLGSIAWLTNRQEEPRGERVTRQKFPGSGGKESFH